MVFLQSPTSMSQALYESDLPALKLLNRGKVRDIYDIDDHHLLIVTTDRLSAFDVVMPQPIPGKGEVLTRVANFWFRRMQHILPNHLSDIPLSDVVPDEEEQTEGEGGETSEGGEAPGLDSPASEGAEDDPTKALEEAIKKAE